MASSLSFDQSVQNVIPIEVLERLNIIPLGTRNGKLCLISKRPLSSQALMELKEKTGYEDYELQLVGEDVLEAYLPRFKDGTIFRDL